jgi:hypothetical protein
MAIKNVLKENLVLVIGLTLPLILILLFFVATVLPKSIATPPQYELLISIPFYEAQNPSHYLTGFIVKDGVLKARISKNDSKNNNYYSRKLISYDGKTDSVHEITYDLSKLGNIENGSEITLDETKNLKIDTSNKAPDGYAFDGPSYGHGGLIPELFGSGHRNWNLRVKKGMLAYKIPNTSSNYSYYGDVQFIGWVVAKN